MILNLLAVTMFFGCSGKAPANLGVTDGAFADCPSSPNCVSSQVDVSDSKHYIAPIVYEGELAKALERMIQVLNGLPRNRIVQQDDNYLRVEFSSAVMGFVDDVEFLFTSGSCVHVRSASRLGYSDFGVNRKRIEEIRRQFEK